MHGAGMWRLGRKSLTAYPGGLLSLICPCRADWVPTRVKAVYLVLGFRTGARWLQPKLVATLKGFQEKEKKKKKGLVTHFGLAPPRLGKCYRLTVHGRVLDVFVCDIGRHYNRKTILSKRFYPSRRSQTRNEIPHSIMILLLGGLFSFPN